MNDRWQMLPIEQLEQNTGQIPGLGANPRQWTNKEVKAMAKSLRETPELFEARPCLVLKNKDKFVVLGGNLRLAGARENKDKTVPCWIINPEIDLKAIREIIIKDNGAWGAWDYDALANEWDDLPLSEWGVKVPEVTETERLSTIEVTKMYYEPTEKPALSLIDCVNFDKYKAKMKVIDDANLSEEQKAVLRWFAYRFLKIDFEAVANYYTYNASEAEREVIERLRLVLVDGGGIEGFIEDDLLRLANYALNDAGYEVIKEGGGR